MIGWQQGASKGEQLIAAARGNNTDLLKEIIASFSDAQELVDVLNNTKTPMGNYIYHEAALNGNCMNDDISKMSIEQKYLFLSFPEPININLLLASYMFFSFQWNLYS